MRCRSGAAGLRDPFPRLAFLYIIGCAAYPPLLLGLPVLLWLASMGRRLLGA